MTRVQERGLFCVALVAAVVVTAAIGHAGGPKVVKAATKQTAISVERQDAVAFEPERIVAACPSIPSGLFGDPLPTPAPKTKVKPSSPTPVVNVQSAPDPLADYRYTGLTRSRNDVVALIEHKKTKEGHYLRAGDPFLGGTVASVSPETITVQLGSETLSLSRHDRYSLVPLDKDAPAGNVQAAQQSDAALPLNVIDLMGDDPSTRWTASRLLTTRLHSYISAYRVLLFGRSDEEAMNRQFEGR